MGRVDGNQGDRMTNDQLVHFYFFLRRAIAFRCLRNVSKSLLILSLVRDVVKWVLG